MVLERKRDPKLNDVYTAAHCLVLTLFIMLNLRLSVSAGLGALNQHSLQRRASTRAFTLLFQRVDRLQSNRENLI